MKPLKTLFLFIFLSTFALQISAQTDDIPTCFSFTNLLKTAPKKIPNLELGVISPNELEGYKFFNEGKLKNLKLGISTVEDVKAIFGTACDDLCEYDSNWKVLFIYFKNISVQTMRDEKKIKLIAEPESVNKLYSISIIPNNEVSLKDVKFSNEFYKSSESITGHDFSGNSSRISVAVFSDSYGLKYSIFNREDYSTFKEKNTRQNGSLIEIKYTIPNNLEEKMFIEQK